MDIFDNNIEENATDRQKEKMADVVSRRMRLMSMRKRDYEKKLEEEKKRKEEVEKMQEQSRHTDYTVARLNARLQILDLFVSKSLAEDSFLARKEMNPWRFSKKDLLRKKWEYVNNVVTTQELLMAIQDAKQRKNQGDSSESGIFSARTSERLSAVDETPELSTQTPECSQSEECSHEEQSQEEQSGAGVSETAETSPHSTAETSPQSSYPVVGKATVYQSGRRTFPKSSKMKDADTSEPLVKEETAAESITSVISSNDLKESEDTDKQPIISKDAEDNMKRKSIKRSRTEVKNPTIVRTVRSKSQIVKPVVRKQTTALPQEDNPRIVYAFGSYHRVDTCQYCGKGLLQEPLKGRHNHHSHLTPSPEMVRRVNDIAGIYERQLEKGRHFRRKCAERIQDIDASEKQRLRNVGERPKT